VASAKPTRRDRAARPPSLSGQRAGQPALVGGGLDDCHNGKQRTGVLEISERTIDGARLVELQGEIDLLTVPAFIERLYRVATGDTRIVLDVDGLRFMDSTLPNTLLASISRVRRHGGNLVIVCSRKPLCRILELTGIDQVYPVVTTHAEGLRSLWDQPDSG
jgi:anti-sigma B factor antagonist